MKKALKTIQGANNQDCPKSFLDSGVRFNSIGFLKNGQKNLNKLSIFKSFLGYTTIKLPKKKLNKNIQKKNSGGSDLSKNNFAGKLVFKNG